MSPVNVRPPYYPYPPPYPYQPLPPYYYGYPNPFLGGFFGGLTGSLTGSLLTPLFYGRPRYPHRYY